MPVHSCFSAYCIINKYSKTTDTLKKETRRIGEEAGIASETGSANHNMQISPGQQMHQDWIVTLLGAWEKVAQTSEPPNPNSHSAAGSSTGSSRAEVLEGEPSPVTDICPTCVCLTCAVSAVSSHAWGWKVDLRSSKYSDGMIIQMEYY